LYFSRVGIIRKHFEIDGSKENDAIVWGQALNGHSLVEYSEGPDGEPIDLANADDILRSRVSKFPKWQRDCFFQFGLPLIVLLVLFSISYLLVVLGPLKGIGSLEGGATAPQPDALAAAPGVPAGSGVTIDVIEVVQNRSHGSEL
jgi:hypothetical protein